MDAPGMAFGLHTDLLGTDRLPGTDAEVGLPAIGEPDSAVRPHHTGQPHSSVALHFSDSSRIFVNSIPNDGNPKVVDFDTKQIEWVRIEVTDADGIHVGFSEVEVFLFP